MILYKRFSKDAAVRALYAACALLFFSCATLPPERTTISRSLTGQGVVPAELLAAFLRENNASVSQRDALYLARCYISEANDEGINSDVAFAQMCLETGFLKFGGLVTADMHNYCGLGAIDETHRGESFETVQLGVRAHIQHLNAYGDTDELVNPVVDKRARFVTPRGKAPTIFELAGTWAQDAAYGAKLDGILTRMEGVHRVIHP
ncbi:MAG: glucosaminidase domain-containing protein [Treponema sp.]|nr:glucosaminidase domain-containing protein [Treponema sp.]